MSRLEKQFTIAPVVACAMLAALTATVAAQNLQLDVSPFSGAVTIQNTSNSPVSLDGYQVTSASGELVPNPTHSPSVGWQSLTDAGQPGWSEFSDSTSALSELNLSSSTSIPAGGTVSLGYSFTAYGTEDVSWGYSVANGAVSTSTLPGAVHYGGGATLEVITLLGAGSSTVATPVIIANVESQASVTFDGYVIQSASGSLNPSGFDGFAGHSVAGWQSVTPSANALSELNLTQTPTMAAGHFQPLGTAFASSGTPDLTFQVHVLGPGFGDAPFVGDVLYKSQLAGDVNQDGIVNGLDIAAVASHWLQTNTLAGDANYDGIVNGLDISLIAAHWLLTGGSGSGAGGAAPVPEPSTITLLALGLCAVCGLSRGRRHP